MKRLIAVCVFLLLPELATARAGAWTDQRPVEVVETDPAVVREFQPFDLMIRGFWSSSAQPAAPEVRLDGDVINIITTNRIDESHVSQPWGTRVRIGGLPAGKYGVALIADGEGGVVGEIEVLPGAFSVVPPFGPAGNDVMIEGIPLNPCSGPLICGPLQVTFGSLPATDVRVTVDKIILAKPPVPPAGVENVDVIVRSYDGSVHTLDDAFTYGTAGNPGNYERLLFPMIFAGAGAHGSQWRSENLVRNDAPVPVPVQPAFQTGATTLAPGSRARMREVPEDAGAFLWVARGADKWMTYSSHIADRSRSAVDRGSELPVVRTEDTSAEIRLIDVPLRALYRARLRLYDFDSGKRRNVTITVTRGNGAQHVIRRVLEDPLGTCTSPCMRQSPAMLSLDLSAIPELADAGKVDVSVRAETRDARLWAFVSISNNETQHVTMFTPQHDGVEVVR